MAVGQSGLLQEDILWPIGAPAVSFHKLLVRGNRKMTSSKPTVAVSKQPDAGRRFWTYGTLERRSRYVVSNQTV